jgi:hypothetical protein
MARLFSSIQDNVDLASNAKALKGRGKRISPPAPCKPVVIARGGDRLVGNLLSGSPPVVGL